MEQKEEVREEVEAQKPEEPWEAWEGRLVNYSLIIGVVALAVLGVLINVFVLS